MRLFSAIRPSQAAIEHLVGALRPVRERSGTAIRWADPDQWHLTCAFYGEVSHGLLPSIESRLSSTATTAEPLDLLLSGAGSFGGRTLWIGAAGDTDRFAVLAAACMVDLEARDRHRAHLTVARVSAHDRPSRTRRTRGGEPGRFGTMDDVVRALSVYRGPTWTADRIELVESELGRGRSGGPLHRVIATYPLGGSDRR
jgi:2'-5' RNA ligase